MVSINNFSTQGQEHDLPFQCGKCGRSIHQWSPLHFGSNHYEMYHCTCGYQTSIKVYIHNCSAIKKGIEKHVDEMIKK